MEHRVQVDLIEVTTPSIILGYSIGSGDSAEGHHVEILASGNTVRFRVSKNGVQREWDAKLNTLAAQACALFDKREQG